MMESLKILMLGDGHSFHVARLIGELKRVGHEVCLASLEHSEIVDVLLKRRGPIRSLHYTLAASQLVDIFDKFSPAVVYAHYATGYGHMAAVALEKAAVPIVLNLWGSDILIVPHKSKLHFNKAVRALNAASVVIADSSYLLEAAKRIAPVPRGSVIPWGVERRYLDLYRAESALARPLKIIVPRAHEDVYDNLFLLHSLGDSIKRGEVEVTFPAFGSRFEKFMQESDHVAGGKTRYYQRMKRADFMRYLTEFDVYLSNARSDSSPVSMIEAMGLGLTVVARDIPGVREWLSPENGFLYEAEDAGALQAIVAQLMRQDLDLQKIRASNRQRVLNEAVFEENVAAQVEIMKELRKGMRK